MSYENTVVFTCDFCTGGGLGELESRNEGGTLSDRYCILLPSGWEGTIGCRQFCSEMCEAKFLQRQFAAKVKTLEGEAKEGE